MEYSFNALGRLAVSHDRDIGESLEYFYDAEGNRTSLAWGRDKEIRYEYGKAGELRAVIDPENGRTEYDYDAALRETLRSLPNGIKMKRSYDGAGRLSAIKSEGSNWGREKKLSNEAYVYDLSGRRTYTVDEEGRITAYRYDDQGRVKDVLYPFGVGKVGADFEERLEAGLYPEYEGPKTGGKPGSAKTELGFSLPPVPGLEVEDLAAELAKELAGRGQIAREFKGIEETEEGRWRIKPGAGAGNFAERLAPSSMEAQALRAAGVRANGRGNGLDLEPWLWVESYEYDERENRTRKINGWGEIAYSYDAENRLQRAGNREYAYDSRGNLIEESLGGVKAEFAYDGEDRLVDAFTKVEGFLGRGKGSAWSLKAGVRYEYDALGRRVSRAEYDLVERGRKQERNWDLSSAEEYLYEGQSMDVLAEYRDWDYRPGTIGAPHLPWFEGGSRPKWGSRKEKPWNRRGWGGRPEEYRLEAEYVYAQGEILSRDEYDPAERWSRSRRDGEYYTQGLLGSVMMTTDAEGKVRERYEYDAFGQAYGGTIQRMNNLGYNGKRLDPRTGLYDYGFRDYAPKQGRFTTVDPIRDGENWYAYVGNDPVNYTDPWGFESADMDGSLSAYSQWAPIGLRDSTWIPTDAQYAESRQRVKEELPLLVVTVAAAVIAGPAIEAVAEIYSAGNTTAKAVGGGIGFISGGINAALEGEEPGDVLISAFTSGLNGALFGGIASSGIGLGGIVLAGAATNSAASIENAVISEVASAGWEGLYNLNSSTVFSDAAIAGGIGAVSALGGYLVPAERLADPLQSILSSGAMADMAPFASSMAVGVFGPTMSSSVTSARNLGLTITSGIIDFSLSLGAGIVQDYYGSSQDADLGLVMNNKENN